MTHRSARPRALRFPILIPALLPAAAFLAGCLGGDLDSSTVIPASKDTVVVGRPPKDTTPVHDTVPAGAVHSLYPRLKNGDKWDFTEYSAEDTGTAITYEILGDSVYGSDSVYIESFTERRPDYVAGSGYLIIGFTEKDRLYLRKSDQETVRDTLTLDMQVMAPGDSVMFPYREESSYTTALSGNLPDSLKNGAAWKLTLSQRQRTNSYFQDSVYRDDTTRTWTRFYGVRASPSVTVKAGAFPAIEIDESDSGSGKSYQVWFSPDARNMIRQIYTDSAYQYADTTELTNLQLK